MCVCACMKERERERVCACVYLSVCVRAHNSCAVSIPMLSKDKDVSQTLDGYLMCVL